MIKVFRSGFLLALGLLSGGAWAEAAPEPQTCAPMEVLHSSSNGLVYALSCQAGAWKLAYSGAVPAVSGAVTAAYRLKATSPTGEVTQHARSVALPDIGKLGQYLVREAVAISGNLALRDCSTPGCTKYKLLGGATAQAVAMQNPELERARAEILRLQSALDTALNQLSELQKTGAALEAQSTAEREKLAALEGVQSRSAHVKTLLAKAKDDMAKLRAQAMLAPEGVTPVPLAAVDTQQARIASLERQLAAVPAKKAAEADRAANAEKLAELAKQKTALEEEVARLLAQQKVQAERVQGLEQQLSARVTEVATLEAKVGTLTTERDALLTKVAALEQALSLSKAETAILERAVNQLSGEEPVTAEPPPASAAPKNATDDESSEITIALPGAQDSVKIKKGRKKPFSLW